MRRLSIMGPEGHRELAVLDGPEVEVATPEAIDREFDRLIAQGYQAFVTEIEGGDSIPVRTTSEGGVRRAIERPSPSAFDITMFPNGAGG